MTADIIFKPHSFVDVITNSSTTIYTIFKEEAVDQTYKLIDEVLKVAGSKANARELFDVNVYPALDVIIENLEFCENEIEKIADPVCREYLQTYADNLTSMGYDEFTEWKDDLETSIEELLMKDNLWKVFSEDNVCRTYIKIVAKDKSKSTKDLGDLIYNMFYCEEVDC